MTTSTVVERALGLKAVVVAALSWPREMDETSAPQFNEEADHWWDLVKQGGGYDSLTSAERTFAELRWPHIDQHQVIQFSWRMEAYNALLWALGLVESLGCPGSLASTDLLNIKASTIKESAVLRDDASLAKAQEAAEIWHWRCRTRQLFHGQSDMAEIIRGAATGSHSDGLISEVVDGDFGVDGVAFRDLPEPTYHAVHSVCQERHFALNWLFGHAPNDQWDETPTDT